MDTFLETYNLPNLSVEEGEDLNTTITADENEAVIKNCQHTIALGQVVSQEYSTKHLRKS